MKLKPRHVLCHVLLSLLLCAAPLAAKAVQVQRSQDRVVTRIIRFAPGTNSTIVKERIRLGLSHQYKVRARVGQRMQVVLTTRGRTSFTISTRNAGIIKDADGVKSWVGDLTETGEYLIVIGTDSNADYTLEVAIM